MLIISAKAIRIQAARFLFMYSQENENHFSLSKTYKLRNLAMYIVLRIFLVLSFARVIYLTLFKQKIIE